MAKRKHNKRKNPSDQMVGRDILDVNFAADPDVYPLWYKQFLKLSVSSRRQIFENLIRDIKEAKPDSYKFIKDNDCELIGLQPSASYVLLDEEDSLKTTWIHGYSMPTALFWCEAGGFCFAINPNLKYNDTVLNLDPSNPKQTNIRGLTS